MSARRRDGHRAGSPQRYLELHAAAEAHCPVLDLTRTRRPSSRCSKLPRRTDRRHRRRSAARRRRRVPLWTRGSSDRATPAADVGQGRIRVPEQPADEPVWSYEPKWDGFRAIVFRDGADVVLGSRGGKTCALLPGDGRRGARGVPERCVVDGELVVPREIGGRTRLDWGSLSERIHPADSRVRLLAAETPAQFIGFDLLALGRRRLHETCLRGAGAALLGAIGGGPSCHVTSRDARRRHRRALCSRRSRAPDWTASSPSASTATTCRTSGRW